MARVFPLLVLLTGLLAPAFEANPVLREDIYNNLIDQNSGELHNSI